MANKKRKHKSKRPPATVSGAPLPATEPQSSAPSAGEAQHTDDERTRSIAWLIEAFSSLSVDQIGSAYCEAGGDVFKAAGILGAQLEDPGDCAGPVAGDGESGKGSKVSGGGGGRKRRQKRGVAVASTGMVANVIGKEYGSEGRRGGVQQENGEMRNRAYNVREAEDFLCSMIGEESNIGMDVVKDVLGQCGCDIEKALEVLLDISVSSSFQIGEKGHHNYLNPSQRYSGTGPEIFCRDPPKNLINLSKLTDNAPEKGNHPPKGLGNAVYGFWDPVPDKSEVMKPELQQKVLESLFNIPEFHEHNPDTMDWKKVLKKVESLGQGLEFASTSSSDAQSDDSTGKEDIYQVSRSIPKKNWDMMRVCYQKAALAYSKGQRSYAAYLSEQGRVYRDLAHAADERASREIFEARNKDIKNIVTIDLHGQHVKQAIGLLKLHLILFTYIPSVRCLRVITGCGDGVGMGKLKRSVIGLVEKEHIEWKEENVGTIILRVDQPKEYSFVDCDSDSDQS